MKANDPRISPVRVEEFKRTYMEFDYLGKTYKSPLICKIDGIYDANGKEFLKNYNLDEEIQRLIVSVINLAMKKKKFWFF